MHQKTKSNQAKCNYIWHSYNCCGGKKRHWSTTGRNIRNPPGSLLCDRQSRLTDGDGRAASSSRGRGDLLPVGRVHTPAAVQEALLRPVEAAPVTGRPETRHLQRLPTGRLQLAVRGMLGDCGARGGFMARVGTYRKECNVNIYTTYQFYLWPR